MRATLQRLALVLLVLVAGVADAQSVYNTSTTTRLCQNVSTLTTIIPAVVAPGHRVRWDIVMTSGAGVIYWQKGTGAAVKADLPLGGAAGVLSYDESGNGVYSGAVTAIALSGTSWVCTTRDGA